MKAKFAVGGKAKYPEKNPQRQIDTNLSPLAEPRPQSRVVEAGGATDGHYTKCNAECKSLESIETMKLIEYGPK